MGDVAAIAESLTVNGQYSPIVVWNDTIIAGTHTWKAAKSLGWKEIAVTRYDGSEKDAIRVLIADNRMSDIATYNNEYLLDLLVSLPDLEGTGYEPEYLEELKELDEKSDGVGGGRTSDELEETSNVKIRLGEWHGELDADLHEIWLSSVVEAVGDKKSAINKELRARLDVPKEPKAPKADGEAPTKQGKSVPEATYTLEDTELVSLAELRRFPSTPREGDIGAISESLRLLGQYRPVVVNKRNNQILKGNHTAAAASSLGWKEIAVVWVDVDDEQATKIVLADNRTADKATYDNDLLASMLDGLSSLEGTGFDYDDYSQVREGKSSTPKEPKIKFKIGEYGFSAPESIYNEWREEVELPTEALHRLGIPLTAVIHAE
jgi:hypothetical protein